MTCLMLQFGQIGFAESSARERMMERWESYFREKSRRRRHAPDIRMVVIWMIVLSLTTVFVVALITGANALFLR